MKYDEMKGAQILRNETHLLYAARTNDEAQHGGSGFSTACHWIWGSRPTRRMGCLIPRPGPEAMHSRHMPAPYRQALSGLGKYARSNEGTTRNPRPPGKNRGGGLKDRVHTYHHPACCGTRPGGPSSVLDDTLGGVIIEYELMAMKALQMFPLFQTPFHLPGYQPRRLHQPLEGVGSQGLLFFSLRAAFVRNPRGSSSP